MRPPPPGVFLPPSSLFFFAPTPAPPFPPGKNINPPPPPPPRSLASPCPGAIGTAGSGSPALDRVMLRDDATQYPPVFATAWGQITHYAVCWLRKILTFSLESNPPRWILQCPSRHLFCEKITGLRAGTERTICFNYSTKETPIFILQITNECLLYCSRLL